MDLRQLEILRAVAQTGSFTSAGQELHLSQSAVSRQILLLEEELHEQLFLRLGRKIRITPAGTTLLGLSQRMFEDLDRTRATILENQKTVSGTVRLVGGMTVCLYVFPALLTVLGASGMILGAWYLFTLMRRLLFGEVQEPETLRGELHEADDGDDEESLSGAQVRDLIIESEHRRLLRSLWWSRGSGDRAPEAEGG